MKYYIIFNSNIDYITICKNMSNICNSNEYCPFNDITCPFCKSCKNITIEDWKNIIKFNKE